MKNNSHNFAGRIWIGILLICANISVASGQHIDIWSGEDSDDLICSLNDYMSFNDSQAFDGEHCLEARFDQWNHAQLRLDNCSHYRLNINYTQALCFQVKSNMALDKLSIQLNAWHSSGLGQSDLVDLSPYLNMGNISDRYQQVCIPLDDFRENGFTALWLEAISFKAEDPDPQLRVYIDDVFLRDQQAPEVDYVESISNQAIRVHFDGRYDRTSVQDLTSFYLISSDDPDFQMAINPDKIGQHFYYDGLESDSLWLALPKSHFTVLLYFNEEMKAGKMYHLHVKNIGDPAANIAADYESSFIYTDKEINGTVKVNQLGYLPESPKFAYAGNYLGSAGPLILNPELFHIVDADSDEIVFEGSATFRAEDLSMSGERIYECDFSNFTTVGNYYIHVPGIGRSRAFNISVNAFDDAYLTAFKGLYFSRCGMELSSEHAGVYARPSCHLNDCLIHESIKNADTYGGEIVGTALNVRGGWHDAGDYSRPLSNQIVVCTQLLEAYEKFPEKFRDDLNIPESGNEIPDILDEAKWSLDYLLNMQSDDGGVFFKVASTGYPRKLAHQDSEQYYVSAKTTFITAMYAAVLAKAARVYQHCIPDFSAQCLNSAERAWDFLATHNQASPSFGYLDDELGSDLSCGQSPDDGDDDERAWAAVELYRTTGNEIYHDAFKFHWGQNDPFFGWSPTIHSQKRAAWSYYAIQNLPVEQDIRTRILNAVKDDADEILNRTLTNPYRGEYRSDHAPFIGWGSYNQSTQHAMTLLQTYFISNEEKYLDGAKINLDPQFGNNPLGKCFVTGIGDRSIRNPIHFPSELDGIAEPVPGIPVFGAHHREEYQYRMMIDSFITYPHFYNPLTQSSEYPTLRRYFDQPRVFSMNEFTIAQNMGSLIYTLAYFSDWNEADASCLTTATEEQEILDLSIYPNPTAREIVFQQNNIEAAFWELYNIDGNAIRTGKANVPQGNIDLVDQVPGIYLVSFFDKKGQTIKTVKVFKVDE